LYKLTLYSGGEEEEEDLIAFSEWSNAFYFQSWTWG
jgi:hypothetical protein